MRRWLVASLLLASLLLGGFHAAALLTDGDADGVYLHHGWLIVRGELGLYAPEMTGHRTPLPYYLIGLSQVLFGPSVLAGRVFSLLAGWAGVLILWRAARRSLGEPAGTLALLLLATNAYLMSHFSVAAFHGLAFFWVALGAWYMVASDSPWRRALIVLCAWGLFLTRPQFGLLIPVAGLWGVWTAKTPPTRQAVIAATVAPGVLFFIAYWPGVLKMAAYVPGLEGMAARWGYVPIPMPGEPDWGTRVWRAAALVLRSYKAWIALGLVAWAVWPVGYAPLQRPAKRLLLVFLMVAASQLLVVNASWKVAVGYFPAFSGLLAVPLAARYAQLLGNGFAPPGRFLVRRRWMAAAALGLMLLAGPAWSPPPNLPLAVDPSRFAALEAERAGRELARLIPPGTPIFLFGPATLPHLAGLRPPIQPSNHLETLTNGPAVSPKYYAGLYDSMRRSGLWATSDILEWLSRDPRPWAVVWTDGLNARRQRYNWGLEIDVITHLLKANYEPAGTVAYHGIVLELWRRKS